MRNSIAIRPVGRSAPGAKPLRRVALRCAPLLAILLLASTGPVQAAALSAADREHYRAAFKAAEKNSWTSARRHARDAREPLPRKILAWLEMTHPGNTFDFDAVTGFIKQHPDWPRMDQLRRRAEEAITESTPTTAILAWFSRFPPETTDGLLAYGQALIVSGRRDEGYALVRRAWIEGTFSRRAEVLFMRQYHKLFTGEDHWARLDRLVWDGHNRSAERMLRRVSRDRQALAVARMRLRHHRGGVDGAIARVPPGLRRDPGLLYERMRWRRLKNRDAEAMEILANPPDRLVRPDLWARERVIVARRMLAAGRITDAFQAVRVHALDQSHGARFAETEWMAGWIALRFLREAKSARARFERLYEGVSFPVSRARAAYWAGRAAQAMKDEAGARDWFRRAAIHPTTYHGQLAVVALGDRLVLPPPPMPPKKEAVRDFENLELARAARMLWELGQKDYLRWFVVRLSRLSETPAHKLLTARFAASIGRPDLGVWVARYAQRESAAILPFIGYPIIDVPNGDPEPALLLAIARQESNFNPNAISHAGARGVMQLMPATARQVARQNRLQYSRSRLTEDPSYNIRLGRSYLADMLKKFEGSYVLAVAAYNAGPQAVTRWLRENGDPRNSVDDPIDWIELIPYGETRNYVQRVLGNLQVYRGRLQPGRVVMTLEQDLRR